MLSYCTNKKKLFIRLYEMKEYNFHILLHIYSRNLRMKFIEMIYIYTIFWIKEYNEAL